MAIFSPLHGFHQPSLQELKEPTDLNASMAAFYQNLFTDKPDDILQATYPYVHVHDIAAAHVAALRNEVAGGERIIISEGAFHSSQRHF